MTQPEDSLRKLKPDVVTTQGRAPGEIPRVEHYRHQHPPVRDVNQEFRESFTPIERTALWVTNHVGVIFRTIMGHGFSPTWARCFHPSWANRFSPKMVHG